MSLHSEARLPEYNSLVCYRQAGEFGSPRLDRANYLTSSRTTFLIYKMSMMSLSPGVVGRVNRIFILFYLVLKEECEVCQQRLSREGYH